MEYFFDLFEDCPCSSDKSGKNPIKSNIPPEKLFGFLLNFQELMDLNHRLFADESLTRPELVSLHIAMDYPYRNNGEYITPAEIGKRICMHPSAVSRMLGRLSEMNLVRREISTADRRIVKVIVTDKGKAAVKHFLCKAFSVVNTAMEEFSEEEISQMLELQGKFVGSLRKIISQT